MKLLLLVILLPVFLASSKPDNSTAILSYESKNPLRSSVSTSTTLPGPYVDLSTWTSGGKLHSSNDKSVISILAEPDGTIFLYERSLERWKYETGSPFLKSEQSRPDLDYFIKFDENGQLQEYTKKFGYRALTIQDFVPGAAIFRDFDMISVSQKTTLHFLKATSGEVIDTNRSRTNGSNKEVSIHENRLFGPRMVDNAYIMLVVTDYLLTSTVFPIDPTQISTEITKPVWQCSRSYVTAVYVKNGQALMTMPVYMKNKPIVPSSADHPFCLGNKPPMLSPADRPFCLGNKPLMLSPADHPFCLGNKPPMLSPADRPFYLGNKRLMPSLADPPFYLGNKPLMLSLADHPFCLGNKPPMSSPADRPFYLENKPLMLSAAVRPFYLENHEQERFKLSSIFSYANIVSLSVLISITGSIIFLRCKSILVANNDNQILLKGKQLATKKKKGRKNGNVKNSSPVSGSPDGYGMQSVKNKVTSVNTSEGRWVGKLFVSNFEIGRGSNGTVVLEGTYKGHPVAVKRLLRAHHEVANKEVEILFASDRHPNVVRWYGVKEDTDFVYISLERCSCNLSDLIRLSSESSVQPTDSENQASSDEDRCSIYYDKGLNKNIELWSDDGFPSLQLLNLMRDVVTGLAHLHKLGIIHRDMKPQNVLISINKDFIAKLSDMGISKRLVGDMTSVSYNATVSGTSGWQAPEHLLHGRYTRAVDLFSLGCILFFCITKGSHPFGSKFERDSNIANNRIDLFLVEHIPEAVDLLLQLLNPDPNLRLSATEVLHHPFFWDPEMRLSFLRDTSDRVELEDRESESELLKALESVTLTAFGGKWGDKMDAAVINDIGRYRKYKFDSMRDLLRMIRNKLNHYRELRKGLQEILGPVPEGFNKYFSSRFPKLLVEVYKVISIHCSNEDSFKRYFKGYAI